MRHTSVVIAGIVGCVLLVASILVLWQYLADFALSSHPHTLPGQVTQKTSSPNDANDTILVMSDPQQLGGMRASMDSLGTPHVLGGPVEGKSTSSQDFHSDCSIWVMKSIAIAR